MSCIDPHSVTRVTRTKLTANAFLCSVDTTFNVIVQPTVRSLSLHASGTEGGQELVIHGSGFREVPGCAGNVVAVQGSPCTVTACTQSELRCIIGPEAPPPSPTPGVVGLIHKFWWNYTVYSADLEARVDVARPNLTWSHVDALRSMNGTNWADGYAEEVRLCPFSCVCVPSTHAKLYSVYRDWR